MRWADKCLVPVVVGLTTLLLTGCHNTQRTIGQRAIDVTLHFSGANPCSGTIVRAIVVDENGKTVGSGLLLLKTETDGNVFESKLAVHDAAQYQVKVFDPCSGEPMRSGPYTAAQVDEPNFVVDVEAPGEVG